MPEKYFPKTLEDWKLIKPGDKLYQEFKDYFYGTITWIDYKLCQFHLAEDTNAPKFNYTFEFHSTGKHYFILSKPKSYKKIFIESLTNS